MARDLLRVVSSGEVGFPCTDLPLEDVVSVHRALENRETTGSIVLIP